MKLFSKLSYPVQELSDKQKELLDLIDSKLIEAHKGKLITGQMAIKYTGISLMRSLLPINNIVNHLKLETGDAYMPRSIALIVNSDGDWVFVYAVRTETGSDALTTLFFIDALNRTNNSR